MNHCDKPAGVAAGRRGYRYPTEMEEKMKINIVHSKELDKWIAEHHYLHSAPAGAIIRMEIQDDTSQRIGGMMWGRNPSPKQDQRNVLCLTRMYCVDIRKAGRWQWRENISASIIRKSKGWLRIRPPARDMRGLYIKRTDGLRCHARPVERIAGPDAKILTYHQKSSGAGHRKW